MFNFIYIYTRGKDLTATDMLELAMIPFLSITIFFTIHFTTNFFTFVPIVRLFSSMKTQEGRSMQRKMKGWDYLSACAKA